MYKLRAMVIHVVLPLATASLIYLVFRTESLWTHGFVEQKWWEKHSLTIGEIEIIQLIKQQNWLLYNVPDGLWFYAFLSYLLILWAGKAYENYIHWVILYTAVAILSELAQLTNFAMGTFDPLDLGVYLVAGGLSLLNFRQWRKYET